MLRLFFLVLLLSFASASDLKITSAVPFGSSSLRLEANRDIKKNDFNVNKLQSINFIDIHATLTFNKKEYNYSNATKITIVQNSKNKVRVLINLNEKTDFEYTINAKYIYIVIKDKLPPLIASKKDANQKQDSKNLNNKKEANLKSQKDSKENTSSKDLNAKDDKKEKVHEKSSKKQAHNPVLLSNAAFKENAKMPLVHKKVVMIDPGHGGKDCGTMGITGVCEKHIVLNVALKVASILEKRGYVVYITRNKDYFIELRHRTEMANEKKADLFVSIHANSIAKGGNRGASGIETYFLSTARSERALNVAETENKGDIDTMNYYSKSAFLNTLSSHRLILSNKLAIDLQASTLNNVRNSYRDVVDGGVREGPFWVLAGALMPSALIEIGYNSNQKEASRLMDKSYQSLLANGIAQGIESFFNKNPNY